MTKETTGPIIARKSNNSGHIAVSIRLKCRGWKSDHAKIDAGTDITSAQARELAQTLIALADQADAKVAAKAAADERRKRWRDRQVAAGRMVILRGLQ